MRRSTRFNVAVLTGTLAVLGTGGMVAFAGGGDRDDDEGRRVVRALATVEGPSSSGIEGTVRFVERAADRLAPTPPVLVVARIKGLTPGKHGFHIHQRGVCEPPFDSAGGHFDPGPFGNSTPVDQNHPYHLGDLPNLRARANGVGRLRAVTSRITLSPGPLTILDGDGSAIVVHLNEDRGQPGVTGASGGARIACGVIRPVERDDD